MYRIAGILARRKFGDLLHKQHLASFNLAILLHFAVSTVVTKGFKFGSFFSKLPIRQIKTLANISHYTVYRETL